VGSLHKAWEGISPGLMELLCVVSASLAAAFAERGFGVGLASNASLTGEWSAVDLPADQGAVPDVLETLARMRPYTMRDFEVVLAGELADESSTADCVVIVASLRPKVRRLLRQLCEERATTVVFVGRPGVDEAPLVDFVVPGDFEWRTSDALPLCG